MSSSAALELLARAFTSLHVRASCSNPTPHAVQEFYARAGQASKLAASRTGIGETQPAPASQRGHLRYGAADPPCGSADLAPSDAVRAGAARQMILTASALFRRARRQTRQLSDRSSPVVPALHSARKAFAPCLASTPSFRRSQTAETADANIRAPPEKQNTNGREASPDHHPQYGRDAPHVAQDKAIWPRDFVRPRHRISRKHGQLCSQTRILAALAEGKNLV